MSAREILQQYRDGERTPVPGPFTYVEALGLVTVNQKLLAALKELASVPFGSGAETLRTKTRAHYNAINVIAETEAA
ncbi:MAG: hypothetical protein Q8Q81_00545 [Oxalobacteraceae bacterium]|nr:hypothetical protein [Oxalobacteraceae bacterium]